LRIATTHTQARYFLPEPIAQLRLRYPKVQVVLHQGMPEQVARMLLDDVAEIGLATEALAAHPGLITLPCYEWQHVMVVPAGHALAAVERPTLEQLAAQPLVLYQPTVTGRTRIDQAFERAQLHPLVALEAIDSDIIKTYVRLGLGVGIVAESAMRADPLNADASDLVCRPLGHLFGSNVTRVAFKRGAYLRQFVVAFAELLAPRLTRSLLERAMSATGSHGDTDYAL
jgi:LysR family cys regulon transcriptional activator